MLNRFLLFAFLLLGVLFFGSSAWAGYMANGDWGEQYPTYDSVNPSAACAAMTTRYAARYPTITFGGSTAGPGTGNGDCKATLNGGALTKIGLWYWDGKPSAPLDCPYGQTGQSGTCQNICPTGQHYGRTAITPFEVSACMDNCPANTFDTTKAGKLSVCAPTPPKDTSDPIKTTCDSGFLIVGFAADGSAICKSKPVPPDPCPKGTHNISADVSNPNCTTDKQEKQEGNTAAPVTNPDGSKTVTKTETTTNSNGTTETKTTKTTTNADGSTKEEVTYSGTGNGSATAGGAGTGTNQNGAGGGGGGGGGGAGAGKEEGDGVSELPENLYEKKKQTFGGSVQTFKDKVVGAPIVTAGSGFFKGQISGGGCFNGVVAIPFLKTSVDFAQYLCGGNVSEVLKVMAIGLMIGASFAAFRMGFL